MLILDEFTDYPDSPCSSFAKEKLAIFKQILWVEEKLEFTPSAITRSYLFLIQVTHLSCLLDCHAMNVSIIAFFHRCCMV